MSIGDGLRERREPALRLPLQCVRAPHVLAPIGVDDGDDDRCAVGDIDLGELTAVDAHYGLAEGQDGILDGPGA